MNNQEKYRALCQHHDAPLYLQPWWLDAVCEKKWDAVFDAHEQSAFAFPFKKKYGFPVITMPMLTTGLGSVGTNDLSPLLAKLPSYKLLDLYLLPGTVVPDKNFTVKERHTYRISGLRDSEKLFKHFSSATRQQIRKAQKNVSISESEDVSGLYKMIALTFKRQNKKVPYTAAYVQRLNAACASHGCRKILIAKDAMGNVHGACFIAWDQHCAYYVMGGSDPKFRSSAAYSLLMWSAIQEAAKHVSCFDFCGSMQPSIARFFAGFAAEKVPYYHITRINSKSVDLILRLRSKIK